MSQCINVMCDNEAEDGQLCADCLLIAAEKAGEAGGSVPEPDQTDAQKETRPDLSGQEAGKVSENTGVVKGDQEPSPASNTQENTTKAIKPSKSIETNGQGRKHKDIDIIEQPDITNLPNGVTHPQGQRNEKTRDMDAGTLSRRIQGHGAAWIQSPEYAEQIHRLQTMKLAQLEEAGITVPMWRKVLG